VNTSKRLRLEEIRKILRKGYKKDNHFNKNKIFDEIIFIFFSWRTPIIKAEEVYQHLINNFLDFNCLFELDENQWFKIFKSSGKAEGKSKIIKKLLDKLKNDFNSVEKVEDLSHNSDQDIFNYLVKLPGIKDKSAYCIMLYSMERAVFPADTHCLRISNRLGIINVDINKKQDRIQGQEKLNKLLRGDYKLCYDLHTTMIQHGKTICKIKPICDKCIISSLCEYNKTRG